MKVECDFIMQQINQLRKLARQLCSRLNLQHGGGLQAIVINNLLGALKVHSMVSLFVEKNWKKSNNLYGFISQNTNETFYLCHCWNVIIFHMHLQKMQV